MRDIDWLYNLKDMNFWAKIFHWLVRVKSKSLLTTNWTLFCAKSFFFSTKNKMMFIVLHVLVICTVFWIVFTLDVRLRRDGTVVERRHRNSSLLFGTRNRVLPRGNWQLRRRRFPPHQEVSVRHRLRNCRHRLWQRRRWRRRRRRLARCHPLCREVFKNFFRKFTTFGRKVMFDPGLVGQQNFFHPFQDFVVFAAVEIGQAVTALWRFWHSSVRRTSVELRSSDGWLVEGSGVVGSTRFSCRSRMCRRWKVVGTDCRRCWKVGQCVVGFRSVFRIISARRSSFPVRARRCRSCSTRWSRCSVATRCSWRRLESRTAKKI